jgi:uncharacterized protein YjbJ (UPF0337 family)
MGEHTDEAKGRIKEAMGDLTGDDALAREGERDQAGATVKGKADAARDKVDDAVDAVKERLDRS